MKARFFLVCWLLGVMLFCVAIGYKAYVAKNNTDEVWESLQKNKDCLSMLLAVNGEISVAYQCKNKTFFKVNDKVVEVENEQ
jgi:hypothetical protein